MNRQYTLILMKKILSFSCLLFLIGCKPEVSPSVNNVIFHKTHEPQKTGAPFSDIVQVGDLYFLSGQIGMNHTTRTLVSGGVQAETTQILENIKSVLKQHGLEMKDIIKCTVILSDIDDFTTFNEIYKQYVPQKPARTTFAAAGLARGAKIEIECIAAKNH